ncbi:MAG: hypothetical protein GX838_03175 [Clostridiaceae bacterium]|nr:hypothetical protein [Clostridiaceae bacterium]
MPAGTAIEGKPVAEQRTPVALLLPVSDLADQLLLVGMDQGVQVPVGHDLHDLARKRVLTEPFFVVTGGPGLQIHGSFQVLLNTRVKEAAFNNLPD